MSIAGLDEAGRGCLAGAVYAAAVILPEGSPIQGLNDSKKLSPARRERLEIEIKQVAQAWAVGIASAEEIDTINILQASLLAMARAVAALSIKPVELHVDGIHAPSADCRVLTIVDGDATVPAIMAASILAKVARDREMRRLDALYPGYGLARHKGYGTADHLAALRRLGPTPIHRRSFAPVAQAALALGASA